MGVLLGGGSSNVSLHHNLMAHNRQRNPRLQSGIYDIVNNVIYNPHQTGGSGTSHVTVTASRPTQTNYVSNYFKSGLDTLSTSYYISGSGNIEIFVQDNISEHSKVVSVPHMTPAVTATTAWQAYEDVLAQAGASARVDCNGAWVLRRDSVDLRIIKDVKNGSGRIIDSPSQVGGWPVLDPGIPCTDTDKDGMPDPWETMYGFNPNDPTDGPLDSNDDGYTNVEEYLNGSVMPMARFMPPTNLRIVK
jgi:hypothetical protein